MAALVDGTGLLRLRIGLGLIVALSAARLLAFGWVESLYVAPRYHFSYAGFEWVQALPQPWMSALVVALLGLGVGVAVGIGGRWTLLVCAFVFTYVELIDKATYLNHYYLISVLLLLLSFTSVTPTSWRTRVLNVPRFEVWALRAQISLVYFFAGVWKLNEDWLLRAEPLSTWLWSFQSTPVVGNLLAAPPTAYFMSWAGAAFDLTIWVFLMWRPTSRVAFAVCIAFHTTLWLMFPIGVFSWVMILSASVLLPRRLRDDDRPPPTGPLQNQGGLRLKMMAVAVLLVIQLGVPLRALATAGNPNWHEQGYRFSWRVMLNEKAGHMVLTVKVDGKRIRWSVHEQLSPLQRRQMAFQPDMLLQYAHHVCRTVGGEGTPDVRMRVDVAWNARRSAPLLNDLNLCRVHDVAQLLRPAPP